MTTNVRALFDAAAQDYDAARRQLVPAFDDLYGTALSLIPFPAEQSIHVLDLGAGTGLLAALIAAAHPHAQLTLADIAPEMLAKARERFAAETTRIQFIELDYVQEPIPGRYDLIVSALSLHHTPPARLPTVFEHIFAALKPGGRFINLDQALGTTPANEAVYQHTWHTQALAKGTSEATMRQALIRIQADQSTLLADQLRWLNEAGFANVDCWYKNFRFVVYSGDKLS